MNKATEVRRFNRGEFTGDARLYELSTPAKYTAYEDGAYAKRETAFVVVSATVVPYSGPETCIFPANEAGDIVNWTELEGSFRGGLDHEEALREAGYEVSP